MAHSVLGLSDEAVAGPSGQVEVPGSQPVV